MECVHLESSSSLSLADLGELVKRWKANKGALKCKGKGKGQPRSRLILRYLVSRPMR